MLVFVGRYQAIRRSAKRSIPASDRIVPEVLDLRSQVFAAAGNHQLWFNRSGELQPVAVRVLAVEAAASPAYRQQIPYSNT
jgi:hypothetical protein